MASATGGSEGPVFTEMKGENPDVTEIESLCLRCHKLGMTRLLLTKIPSFREVVVSSFSCPHCGDSNSSLHSAGDIEDMGNEYTLTVTNDEDMNREVVKSEHCSVFIPHLDFEQPPFNREGEITTVEGLLQNVIERLNYLQTDRRERDAEIAEKIDLFIEKVKETMKLKEPFVLILRDPSGTSQVQNPYFPNKDDRMKLTRFQRTRIQDNLLGIGRQVDEDEEPLEWAADGAEGTQDEGIGGGKGGDSGTTFEGAPAENQTLDLEQEVLEFPITCSQCSTPGYLRMKVIDIPYFKEVVIMASSCEHCGYKDNEVKGGTGIEAQGTKITLHVTDKQDLSRDILKSADCAVQIPAVDMELGEGTLGGKFTTLEGLLCNIKDQLFSSTAFSLGLSGDSTPADKQEIMGRLLERLDQMIEGTMLDYKVVFDDPSGNSYVQNPFAPDPDPTLTVEKYERTDEQNEALGLADMNTENY